MKWNSFRVRLTLWNVAVLALVLGGFGLALCCSIQSWMNRSINRDLAERAHHFHLPRFVRFRAGLGRPGGAFDLARLPSPFIGPVLPEMQAGLPLPANLGRGGSRPHWEVGFGDRGVRWEGAAGTTGGRNSPNWPTDPEAERRAAFLRPRLMNLKGEVLGPPDAPRAPWDSHTVAAALAGHERYSTVPISGERVRVFSAPWYDHGHLMGAIQVARDLREYDRLWHGEIGTLLTLLPLSLLVAGIGGLFLTERALRPVKQVTQAAAQIGAEDLSRRLKVSGRDELAELAETFNGMIGRLESAFEQQRRFTADASHELRTPLTRIKVTTSMALADEPSLEEYQTALRIADQAADVMERLIQQLLLLARADAGQLPIERAPVDLRCVIQEAATMTRPGSAPVVLDLPHEPIGIDGDADHLCRVFVNLLDNALRHSTAEGRITVSARRTPDGAVIRVEDTGEGIPAEHLPHLGERFYRVDAARTRRTGGCGLGLAISQTIVQAHGGQLAIESEVGRGTVVTVSLPRA